MVNSGSFFLLLDDINSIALMPETRPAGDDDKRYFQGNSPAVAEESRCGHARGFTLAYNTVFLCFPAWIFLSKTFFSPIAHPL